MTGTLQITVHRASLLHDTETFGKMDPIARFNYQGQWYKTQEKQDAGKNPVWEQTFCIRVTPEDQAVLPVEVVDKESGDKIDMVGQAQIDLLPILTKGEHQLQITLTYKHKQAGWLLLTLVYIPDFIQDMFIDDHEEQFMDLFKSQHLSTKSTLESEHSQLDQTVLHLKQKLKSLQDEVVQAQKQQDQHRLHLTNSRILNDQIMDQIIQQKENYKFIRKQGVSGKITITSLRLNLTHQDEELFSKIDPFLILKTKSTWIKTDYKKNGGILSSWHQPFQLVATHEAQLYITIYDQSTLQKDRPLGVGVYSLLKLTTTPSDQAMVPIYFGKHFLGHVLFQAQLE